MDGSGKTTQARQLAAWLNGQGVPAATSRTPAVARSGMRWRACSAAQTGRRCSAAAPTSWSRPPCAGWRSAGRSRCLG
nr:hypothetical protein [Parafrankia soli]